MKGVSGEFSLSDFKRYFTDGAMPNDQNNRFNRGYSFLDNWLPRPNGDSKYNPKEITNIIKSDSIKEKVLLSRYFYNVCSTYARFINYYASLYTYNGVLIYEGKYKKSSFDEAMKKIDELKVPLLCQEIATKVVRDGVYYGMITRNGKKVSIIDLPFNFCRSRYRDLDRNHIVEFNLSYFFNVDQLFLDDVLAVFPKKIQQMYRSWIKNKLSDKDSPHKDNWVILPSDVAICIPFNDGTPPLLEVIPASLQYDDAVITDRERDLEEIKKIIVQTVPHTSDGTYLLDDKEVQDLHYGTSGMLKSNQNIDVLTTYCDVDVIQSKTVGENSSNSLDRMLQNVFEKGGVSKEIFAATGVSTLSTSIKGDMVFMSHTVNCFSELLTKIINQLYSTRITKYKYLILPISLFTTKEYIEDTLKLAQSGYSLLLPVLATGLNQQDLLQIKDLENKHYKLLEQLVPLSSSYTQSSSADAKPVGGQEKPPEEKDEKTLENEQSKDNTTVEVK